MSSLYLEDVFTNETGNFSESTQVNIVSETRYYDDPVYKCEIMKCSSKDGWLNLILPKGYYFMDVQRNGDNLSFRFSTETGHITTVIPNKPGVKRLKRVV